MQAIELEKSLINQIDILLQKLEGHNKELNLQELTNIEHSISYLFKSYRYYVKGLRTLTKITSPINKNFAPNLSTNFLN